MIASDFKYAAIILYYRHGRAVEEAIAALLAQSLPPAELVLVDNASEDGVCDELAQLYPNMRVLTLDCNLGYAGGMNFAMRAISPEISWVLFATHDLHAEKFCMQELASSANYSNHRGTAVMLGPMLYFYGSRDVWSAGGKFTKWGSVRHLVAVGDGKPRSVDWLDGACLLVARAAFESVGGFDEEFFLYWEDVDISQRLAALGPVVCAPAAVAFQSTNQAPPYWGARNQVLYWRKRRSLLYVIATIGKVAAKVITEDLVKWAYPTRGGARIVGLWDGLTGGTHKTLGKVLEKAGNL